jgi:hypothetical protein
MGTLNRWLMTEHDYARSPVVSVDRLDRCYVAWIASGSGERVRFSILEPGGSWSPPQDCSPRVPYVTALAMTRFQSGVLMAWIDGGTSQVSGLKFAYVEDHRVGEFRIIADGGAMPAYPAITAVDETFWLFVTRKTGHRRCLSCAVGDGLDEPLSWTQLNEQSTDRKSLDLFPAADAKEGQAGVVWLEMRQGDNRIRCQTLDNTGTLCAETLLVSDDKGLSGVPAICAADGGWWTAWHSDRDPEVGPGLVRGVEIAKVMDDGRILRPTMPPPGIDRNSRETDQGFEFPKIVAVDGGVVLIGRGSQSFRRQDFDHRGWSEPTQIDTPGWSCRGHFFSVARRADGLFVTNREKEGVAVRQLAIRRHDDDGELPLHAAAPDIRTSREETDQDKKRTILAGYRVLFGDIHQHTAASDGTGTIEETFYRARVRYKDKVVAVSDHESFLGKRTPEGEWREAMRIADEFYLPGSFVTLDAYEWTGKMHPGPGHKVVYPPPSGGPLFSRDDSRTGTSKGLLQACWAIGALAVPHHVGWTGADMENHHPEVQTCFEMVSCHGAYEQPDSSIIGTRGDDKAGQFILNALDENLRFGFTGGSDGHGLSWHHGVSRFQDSHRTGLTAFLCHEVTREAVFDALKKRRCYATSGAKIGLWFEVDGRPMGEELMSATPVPFRVIATAQSPIESLCLVTNGGGELELSKGILDADVRGMLPPPPKNGFSYYFVRLVQEDGHAAWSSPIWLDPLASA